MQLNITQLEQVIETAKAKAANSPRWLAAIEKAAEQLISNPYISEIDDHSLLIASATGNDIYISNGSCQCKSFQYGKPCWHRSAARLVQLYREAESASASQPLSWAEERRALISEIEMAWVRKHPRFPLGLALLKKFGTNNLNDLANDMLRGILKAIS
jgi:hypothetical protein